MTRRGDEPVDWKRRIEELRTAQDRGRARAKKEEETRQMELALCSHERGPGRIGLVPQGYESANGVVRYRMVCGDCGWSDKNAIPHRIAAVRALDMVPVEPAERSPDQVCSVAGCDATDVELHHFAERRVFGDDADMWVTALLCRKHHAEYHQRMGR